MESIVILNKNISETPLECIERFRGVHPEYADTKMTYAGRLDPMAEGMLVVLAGQMVHQKDALLKLLKVYEATVVVGIGTDTYDGLGIPEAGKAEPFPPEVVFNTVMSFIGTFEQSYPPYSSKTVNGTQLHVLARSGKLPAIMPSRMVTVLDIQDVRSREISLREISRDLVPKIRNVKGDFRQEEIIGAWRELENPHPAFGHPLPNGEGSICTDQKLITISFTISVSGGTYIRGIADELGRRLGTKAFLWKLKRTKVGDYDLSLSV